MSDTLDELRVKISRGMSTSDAVSEMKRCGLTIIDAIKLTRELYEGQLGAAKEIVSKHPAYNGAATASRGLHDQIIASLEEEQTDGTTRESG